MPRIKGSREPATARLSLRLTQRQFDSWRECEALGRALGMTANDIVREMARNAHDRYRRELERAGIDWRAVLAAHRTKRGESTTRMHIDASKAIRVPRVHLD